MSKKMKGHMGKINKHRFASKGINNDLCKNCINDIEISAGTRSQNITFDNLLKKNISGEILEDFSGEGGDKRISDTSQKQILPVNSTRDVYNDSDNMFGKNIYFGPQTKCIKNFSTTPISYETPSIQSIKLSYNDEEDVRTPRRRGAIISNYTSVNTPNEFFVEEFGSEIYAADVKYPMGVSLPANSTNDTSHPMGVTLPMNYTSDSYFLQNLDHIKDYDTKEYEHFSFGGSGVNISRQIPEKYYEDHINEFGDIMDDLLTQYDENEIDDLSDEELY